MSVSTTTSRESFVGGAGPFSFTFKAFEDTDIKVVIRDDAGAETTLVKDTDFTVAVNDDTGGTVTLIGAYAVTPPTASDTVVVYRDVPYTQDIDLIENDPQHADVLEEGYDRATVLIQQLKDILARSLVLPVSTSYSDLVLPEPDAEKYLRWNAAGTQLQNVALATTVLAVSAFVETLLDDADAAAVLATLGLDADLATLSLPASTTITAFAKTLLDDANAAAMIATLGVNSMPVGTIIPFAGETPPTGYLECNGATVSRTTYATLFAAIGVAWGEGDSSTTFHLPDLRGRFLRGWDHGAARDPDAATRSACNSGGQTGDHVGSVQTEALKSHDHGAAGGHTHGFAWVSPYIAGAKLGSGSVGDDVSGTTSSDGSHSHSTGSGTETRPLNAGVIYCIKY
jgi:microcystin-dependent protein